MTVFSRHRTIPLYAGLCLALLISVNWVGAG